jgi:hypothetical protein
MNVKTKIYYTFVSTVHQLCNTLFYHMIETMVRIHVLLFKKHVIMFMNNENKQDNSLGRNP